MAVVYADTSYLASLYTVDAHTAAAAAYDQVAPGAPTLTSFGRFELQNALRLKVLRQEITASQAEASLVDLGQDLVEGALVMMPCDWEAVFAEADKLSTCFTTGLGQRGMDVLHVAAARWLKAREFLTFDHRQAQLARQAGLQVGP